MNRVCGAVRYEFNTRFPEGDEICE